MAGGKIAWSSSSFHYAYVFSVMFTGGSSHLRVVLHLAACIASLGLGVRFSKEFSCESMYQLRPQLFSEGRPSSISAGGLKIMTESEPVRNMTTSSHGKSSNVHPGRHRILIRPWPHPDPLELAAAQVIIDRVQEEQRKAYEAEHKSQGVIVITTVTHSECPFEAVHLSSLANSLSVARHAITWIVVEGGAEGNSTGEIVNRTRVRSFHVKSDHRSHARLRILGLRLVKENTLEGIVTFLDGLDTPSLDLFDEIQKVNTAAAFAAGFPVVGNGSQQDAGETSLSMLVERPAYDKSSRIRGWEVVSDSGKRQQESTPGEWSKVAFHSNLLSVGNSSQVVADWSVWESFQENATLLGNSTGLLKDSNMLESLERKLPLVWTRRVRDPPTTCVKGISSRQGSWVIHPPLEVVVPSRKTTWIPTLGSHTQASVPPPPPAGGGAGDSTPPRNESNVPSPVTRRSKKHSPRSVRKTKQTRNRRNNII